MGIPVVRNDAEPAPFTESERVSRLSDPYAASREVRSREQRTSRYRILVPNLREDEVTRMIASVQRSSFRFAEGRTKWVSPPAKCERKRLRG